MATQRVPVEHSDPDQRVRQRARCDGAELDAVPGSPRLSVRVEAAERVDDELVAAFARLLPQLSNSPPPDAARLETIVNHPANTVLLARAGLDEAESDAGRLAAAGPDAGGLAAAGPDAGGSAEPPAAGFGSAENGAATTGSAGFGNCGVASAGFEPDGRQPAASESGEIVGVLILVLFPLASGVRAWIEDVVVDERARGQGVGAALNRHAVELARRAGARTVDLTSRPEREAANRLYSRLGFEQRSTNVYRLVP